MRGTLHQKSTVLASFILVGLLSLSPLTQDSSSLDGNFSNGSLVVEKFEDLLSNWLKIFKDVVTWSIKNVLATVAEIARILYVALGVGGFVLWSSGISRYTGKRLLMGALGLAIFMEVLVQSYLIDLLH